MNSRERLDACLSFGEPDRLFYYSMRAPTATIERWEEEGLPRGVDLAEYFGLDAMLAPFWRIPLDLGPVPPHPRTILQETEQHLIYTNPVGAMVREYKDRRDFGSMQWLDFPVKDRQSFLELKVRYRADEPSRYPADWASRVRQWRGRDYPLVLVAHGPFAQLRDWMGIEGACVAFHDQPKLVEEMVEFWTHFVLDAIAGVLRDVEVDWYLLGAEDMAYKTASLLSPQTVRRFLAPSYRRMADFLHSRGVRHVIIDSDGNVDELIPIWLDAGMTGTTPLEVAAGMDPVAVRRQYPSLAMIGGIDKRALMQGPRAIEAEVLSKVPVLGKSAGYIPALDHIISPDIPLSGFRHYIETLKRVATG